MDKKERQRATAASLASEEQSRIERLEEVVREAIDTFEFYEQNHRAKGTPESDKKADRNREMADKLIAALDA